MSEKTSEPEIIKTPDPDDLPQLDLEYSVSDKSLLDDEPKENDQEVK